MTIWKAIVSFCLWILVLIAISPAVRGNPHLNDNDRNIIIVLMIFPSIAGAIRLVG